MKGELKSIHSSKFNITAVSASGNHVLSVEENRNGARFLSVLGLTDEGSSIQLSQVDKKVSFGRSVVLDFESNTVFITLSDEKHLAAFPLPGTSKPINLSDYVLDLNFQSPIFSLQLMQDRIKGDTSNVIVAVSVSGEIALAHFSRKTQSTEAKKSVPQDNEEVLHVTACSDDLIALLCRQKKSFFLRFLSLKRTESLDSLSLDPLTTVGLPIAPEQCKEIVGFTVEEECIALLFAGGEVVMFSPEDEVGIMKRDGLSAWLKRGKEETAEGEANIVKIKMRSAFSLRPVPQADGESERSNKANQKTRYSGIDCGSAVSIGGGFIAFAYGKCVSVWDGKYFVGHSYATLKEDTCRVLKCSDLGSIIVISKKKLYKLSYAENGKMPPLSLAHALQDKGACDDILVSTQPEPEKITIRSHPVVTAPLRAAADGNKDLNGIFGRVIENQESADAKRLRALVSRQKTPSAEALSKVIQDLIPSRFQFGCKTRRHIVNPSKLPSERIASVTVVRCLFEIASNRREYLVPLIDIIGTGVVSSTAVTECLDLADVWFSEEGKEGSLTSFIDPLISPQLHLSALEAVVTNVSDIAEEDVLRILQLGVKMLKSGKQSENSGRADADLSHGMHRLLLKCMTCKVEMNRLRSLLRKLKFVEANELLAFYDALFQEAFSISGIPSVASGGHTNPDHRKDNAQAGYEYRGIESWLDEDYERKRRNGDIDELEGMSSWACCVVDAHLVSLIMDEDGSKMAQRLLKSVQRRRKECEMLRGIKGLTFHVLEKKSLPSLEDPSYRVTVHQIPGHAAIM